MNFVSEETVKTKGWRLRWKYDQGDVGISQGRGWQEDTGQLPDGETTPTRTQSQKSPAELW